MLCGKPPYRRCDQCGRFIGMTERADEGTAYGSGDLEPPDPDHFCQRCAKAEFLAVVEGRLPLLQCWWIKPNWHRMAHAVLKRRRRHEMGTP